MYTKGKQFENQFFIYEPKCIFGGGGGVFNDSVMVTFLF